MEVQVCVSFFSIVRDSRRHTLYIWSHSALPHVVELVILRFAACVVCDVCCCASVLHTVQLWCALCAGLVCLYVEKLITCNIIIYTLTSLRFTEILDDDTFLGAENSYNLFTVCKVQYRATCSLYARYWYCTTCSPYSRYYIQYRNIM